MNRSYNVFVDNGLFILAYYLDKDIEDITEEDVVDNIDVMCDKINKFTDCEKYSNLKSMMFSNSALTQSSSNKTINDYLNDFSSHTGNDVCCLCGEARADISNVNLNRSYLPNFVANTYFNYSNNLKGVNVCGICAILTMYSILNCRVYGLAYLYNSDCDDFMYDYTYEIQEENKRDMLLGAKKSKGVSNTETLEKLLSSSKIYDTKNMEIYKFNNSGQSQGIEIQSIKSNNVKILDKVIKSGLLNEFKEYKLMYELITNRLEYTYLNKIVNDDEVKCSEDLFDFLNREVNRMDNAIIEIIKSIADKLENDSEKIRKKLKLVKTFRDFEGILIELNEEYYEKHEEPLYTVDEYLVLDNRFKFNQIRNLLLVSLMK